MGLTNKGYERTNADWLEIRKKIPGA